MTSFRKPKEVAHFLVTKKCMHGVSRDQLKIEGKSAITSIATEKKYLICVRKFFEWIVSNDYPTSNITNDVAQIFLKEKTDKVRQKTLDGYRQAISLVFDLQLSHEVSSIKTVLYSRAYTKEQISFLEKYSDEHLRLSIQIAATCGLRAHELDTISRPDEMEEDKRGWLQDRFQGMLDSTIFVVRGKGGLRRQIRMPTELAEKLEYRRLPQTMVVTQRGIHYLKRYDVKGGHQFSQQFSRLSSRVLGWSNGAHGLRHYFAQERMLYLQRNGHDWSDAVKILSQELGHFSTTNTMEYLR